MSIKETETFYAIQNDLVVSDGWSKGNNSKTYVR